MTEEDWLELQYNRRYQCPHYKHHKDCWKNGKGKLWCPDCQMVVAE